MTTMQTTDTPSAPVLEIRDCIIGEADGPGPLKLSWTMRPHERWLVTGNNGGGKAALAGFLAGETEATPLAGGLVSNPYSRATEVVSLEKAAALIEEERARDDSDFVEGGVDPGRTPRTLVFSSLPEKERIAFPAGVGLENHPAVALAGIGSTLDRGVKYLSTGEIRRVLLCRALASQARLVVLDDPFDGLDSESRARVAERIESLLDADNPLILIMQDRYESVPRAISRVLELTDGRVSFDGSRAEYEKLLSERVAVSRDEAKRLAAGLSRKLAEARASRERMEGPADNAFLPTPGARADAFVEMKNVTVEWSGRKVLDALSWTLLPGEHWLIRGPNGSGKTTFLELITGDNPQCYRNEIYLFGSRRGTGESIWDVKERIGIVSYRLHVEYRALSGLSLEEVLLSGLHDSIGLYRRCGDGERALARAWLSLAGLAGKERERFDRLSYGEQRATLIARAAVKCPPILILDEPCHGLDATSRDRVLSLLEAIGSGGVSTLLHVTHDPTEALPCERRVLELRPGQTPMYATGERT